jgi:hypothetical protein
VFFRLNDGTEILSLEPAATNATLTLGANVNVHALRIHKFVDAINSSADGAFNSITIGSGGLIFNAPAVSGNRNTTINADLFFGVGGAGEALIFNRTIAGSGATNGNCPD